MEREVCCSTCHGGADEYDFVQEEDDPVIDKDSEEWTLKCEKCGHQENWEE